MAGNGMSRSYYESQALAQKRAEELRQSQQSRPSENNLQAIVQQKTGQQPNILQQAATQAQQQKSNVPSSVFGVSNSPAKPVISNASVSAAISKQNQISSDTTSMSRNIRAQYAGQLEAQKNAPLVVGLTAAPAVILVGAVGAPVIGPALVGAAAVGSKAVSGTAGQVGRMAASQEGSVSFGRAAEYGLTKGARIVSGAASGAKIASKVASRAAQPLVRNPLTGLVVSAAAPVVGSAGAKEAKRFTLTEEQKKYAERPDVQQALQESEYEAREKAQKRGFFEGAGYDMFSRALPGEIPIIGTEAKKARSDFETALKRRLGDTANTRALIELQYAGQVGGLLGLGVGSAGTELAGQSLIGGSVLKNVGKKKLSELTFKEAGKAAVKQAPKFFGLGVVEGTAQEAGRQVAVGEKPSLENLLMAGGFGGISSTVIGVPILGLGMARSKVSKAGAGLLYAGASVLDPSEPVGDILAGRIERLALANPRTKILSPNLSAIIYGNQTQSVSASKNTKGIIEPVSSRKQSGNILTNLLQDNSIIGGDTITKTNSMQDIIGPAPKKRKGIGVSSDLPNFTEPLSEQTNTNTDIFSDSVIPSNIWIPTVTAQKFKPPFLSGFDVGSGKQKSRGRMFYFDEAMAAFGIFGKPMKTKHRGKK